MPGASGVHVPSEGGEAADEEVHNVLLVRAFAFMKVVMPEF